jgi:glutaminyl-peptide cyclotransferase
MVRWMGGAFLLAVALALGYGHMTEPRAGHAAEGRDEFAGDRPVPVAFDAKRAMGYLQTLCKIGPRISGSAGMKKQQELLDKHFTKLGGKVEWQRFSARQRSQRAEVPMAILIVRWHPERKRRVILCSHYDTRPLADQEPDPRKRRLPFVSANDGGSGVALLMELAHHIKDIKTTVGIDFVFFDGEEMVYEKNDDYFFGSKHLTADYRRHRPKHTWTAAVLLDMIGGKNARFPVEAHSWFQAAPLVLELWNTAAELKCAAFEKREGPAVEDDHLALSRAGIPAVDIIDFSYRHWHRLSDVPDNCSGDSLAQVARVLSVWLQRTK